MSKKFHTQAATCRVATRNCTHAHKLNWRAGLLRMEQYHILERIGEGAHGVVLKAKHLKVRIMKTNGSIPT